MEIKTVRFDDGTEVTVVRDGNRIYIDDRVAKKQSNRHAMRMNGRQAMYMHNVVVREDTDTDMVTANTNILKDKEG